MLARSSHFRHNGRRQRFEPIQIVEVQPLQHHPLDTHLSQLVQLLQHGIWRANDYAVLA